VSGCRAPEKPHLRIIVKNLLYHLLALLLGLSLAFGLAEIGVRLFCPQEVGPIRFAFDKDLGEIPVPNQKGRQAHPGAYDFTYTNNSMGFRGNREYGQKQLGSVRVLFGLLPEYIFLNCL
jgi:hypothetical protein